MGSSFVDARAELCARHYAAIRRYVQRLGHARKKREDLVQDTFTVACANDVPFPESTEEQRAWLCKIALHIFTNQEQRRANEAEARALLRADADEMVPSPEEPTIARELVEIALATLTPEEQELVRRHLLEGETLEELAPVFDIGRSTVGARVLALRQWMIAELASRDQRPTPTPAATQER